MDDNGVWIIISIAGGFLLLVGIIAYFVIKSDEKKQPKIYRAWVKMTRRTDITFEDWKLLKENHILPGQVDESSNNGTAVGLLTGVAIGGTINSH